MNFFKNQKKSFSNAIFGEEAKYRAKKNFSNKTKSNTFFQFFGHNLLEFRVKNQ